MGVKRRFWKLVDKGLRKIGLERVSQRWFKELMIDFERGILKVEFRSGFRWAGWLQSAEIKPIPMPPNPIFFDPHTSEEYEGRHVFHAPTPRPGL